MRTPSNLRMNTHRNNVHSPTGGSFDKHFATPGHSFNKNARFILIEQVTTKNLTKMEIRNLLEKKRRFLDDETENDNTKWLQWSPQLEPQPPNPFHLQLTTVHLVSLSSAILDHERLYQIEPTFKQGYEPKQDEKITHTQSHALRTAFMVETSLQK